MVGAFVSFVVIKVIEEESRDAGVQQGNRVVGGGGGGAAV